MRSRRPTTEHQDAVARRLALLSAELAAVRPAPEEAVDPEPAAPAYSLPATHTRVRVPHLPTEAWVPGEPQLAPVDSIDPPEAVPAVPRPGRHASRRAGRTLTGVVPETLHGRVALGPSQLALVAVLVALGLAVTAWWVVRSDPRPVAAPLSAQPVPGLVTPAVPATTEATAAVSKPEGEVTVDVAGRVRRPGIVVLPAGSRVVDALEAAGGAGPRVDLSSLNLARVLVDGEQVLVGRPAVAPVPDPASGVPVAGALVNLNTATAAELETLPEVGPVTAAAILAWRDEHGGFTAVEELLEVDGIGAATLATLTPHVTV